MSFERLQVRVTAVLKGALILNANGRSYFSLIPFHFYPIPCPLSPIKNQSQTDR